MCSRKGARSRRSKSATIKQLWESSKPYLVQWLCERRKGLPHLPTSSHKEKSTCQSKAPAGLLNDWPGPNVSCLVDLYKLIYRWTNVWNWYWKVLELANAEKYKSWGKWVGNTGKLRRHAFEHEQVAAALHTCSADIRFTSVYFLDFISLFLCL